MKLWWIARFQWRWFWTTKFFYPWRSLNDCFETFHDGTVANPEEAVITEMSYWNEG